MDALPGIGSVCSGGRYDNLAALFTSQELPGIGASLGLDRLLAAMEELGMVEKIATPAPVFIPYFDKDRLHDYLRLAAALRSAGIGVEVFPDPKKLGQQLKYADRRGFRVALIAGGNEFQSRRVPSEGPANRPEARRAAGVRRGQRDCGGETDIGKIGKDGHLMTAAKVFRSCVEAIGRGKLITRESSKDKEFHFQNWFKKLSGRNRFAL